MAVTKKIALVSALTALRYAENTECDTLDIEAIQNAIPVLENMIERLENSANAIRKPTPTQIANEGYKGIILEVLDDGTPRSITEIQQASNDLMALSGQRISALLTLLRREGKIERQEVKRKAYFAKVV